MGGIWGRWGRGVYVHVRLGQCGVIMSILHWNDYRQEKRKIGNSKQEGG